MKRGGNLKRRTPLRRSGWPRKSGVARRAGYGESWNWAMDRAGWRCEFTEGTRCTEQAAECHHMKRRSQGGSDDMSNLLAVCKAHHRWIHAHVAESTALGYLIPSWANR